MCDLEISPSKAHSDKLAECTGPIESVPSDIAVREEALGRHVRAREDNVFVISEAILPIGQTDRLPTQSINLDIPDDATALFADKYGSSVFFTP